MKDMLFAILALVSAAIAAMSWYQYTRSGDNRLWLAGFILFIILTVVLGGLFLSGRVNKNEDIHITE